MAIYAATGFSAGVGDLLGADSDRLNVYINSDADYVKSGTYSLQIGHGGGAVGYQRIDVAASSDIEVNFWLHPASTYNVAGALRIKAVLGDATIVELRYQTDHWVAYVNGASVATGTVITNDEKQHLVVRFHIADAGHITARVDGIDDIAYAGDTKPGADATIAYIELYTPVLKMWFCDVPLVCDYDTAFHAAAYVDLLVLNSDAAIAWTRSGGATNYGAVNPIPATTALYNSSSVNAQDDRHGHAGWTGADKTPIMVALHHLARKTEAVADQFNQLLKSGGTTDVATAEDLLTTWAWLHEFYETDPDTAIAWIEAGIDALEVGQRSIIV